ncbi:hypothetical protein M2451_002524 [Dysgonomonas sp. PFB1-18]|uniref:hypothetical protein n=1 Tax=unclassified Dysgonomonas TaxID=2630389 RepID=UPI0024736BB1|nr:MULTISPECIES: hypothetical protein [unclassified Dysgonomonas]MDH6308005.1 hypothetical protein [Dysgonomonas sp. PF1-14]MDH6339544.1 hypothetical protein [Dysgonomonas sp. PF1-16]MDH6381195.1 hypothetical protein [Dysgonomonas sp. PFB1-18]MDH6398407.1 hypothetical protein [Dysgonomonas sp. PF1-23]
MQEKKNEIREKNQVYYPEFWKKRKMNPEFVKDLEESANSKPIATDEHGEYRAGKFLHSCAIVIVAYANNLWSVEIHSQHQVNLPMIREIRYKYLPDNLMMAQLFLPRDQRITDKAVVLYQIPGELRDNEVPTEEIAENESN